MSQIAPIPEREPLELDERGVTAATRAHIIARDKHCQWPGCEISTGLEVDHAIALGLGGRDRDDNLQALCNDHHKIKTRRDQGLIAKAKRRGLKARGEFPKPKRPLKGRGFERRWTP
jgi:5-methylcytosine-specific restriction endonuclease McrA